MIVDTSTLKKDLGNGSSELPDTHLAGRVRGFSH